MLEASSIDLMTPMVALVVDSITLAPTVTVSASEAQNRITAALARSAQTDAKPICPGIRFHRRAHREGAVLGGVPASLERGVGDARR